MNRRLVAGAVATLFVLASASAAVAAPRISLSRDGRTWAPQLSSPLFASNLSWVPGDRRTETFYVRNDSDEPAELLLDIKNTAVQDLYDTGDLTILARSEGPWVEIKGTETYRLVSQGPADQGESRRVDVQVAFDRASSNQSQVLRLTLAFGVRLIDADAIDRSGGLDPSVPQEPGDDDDVAGEGTVNGSGNGIGTAALPDTGSTMNLLIPVLGAACVLGGVVLAGAGRDRRGETR